MTAIQNKILAARSALLWDHPFFGALAVQLIMVDATDDPRIDTMATDGKHLYYHAPFVEKLTKAELLFVFAHEVMHNALEHHIRRQHRDPRLWNYAADFAINGELEGCKVGTMPKGALLDSRFTGLSAEEIYRLLEEEMQKGGAGALLGPGNDPGGCGGVIDACPPHDQPGIAQARAEMQTAVRQAAAIAKASAAGKLPGGVKRIIDQLTAPKVDWQAVLRRFIDENSQKKDFSWARPNRRMLSLGHTMPGTISNGIAHLVIAVDTSGSIDEKILTAFASEIHGAFGDGGVDKITVVYTDTRVNHVDEFELGDELHMEPHGGGGTHFDAAMEWVAENTPDATAMIFFTDAETCSFGEEPPMPVLWTIYGDSREYARRSADLPWGEAVFLDAA